MLGVYMLAHVWGLLALGGGVISAIGFDVRWFALLCHQFGREEGRTNNRRSRNASSTGNGFCGVCGIRCTSTGEASGTGCGSLCSFSGFVLFGHQFVQHGLLVQPASFDVPACPELVTVHSRSVW